MIHTSLRSALLAATLAMPALPAAAQPVPDARASDPRVLGWMEGFPPPPEKRVTQPDSNFFSFPKLRWTVCHIRELLPTKRVSRGLGAPEPFVTALDPAIDGLTFTPLGGGPLMTFDEAFFANYTDGLLILHRGRIVY
jgi:hypothetical protein